MSDEKEDPETTHASASVDSPESRPMPSQARPEWITYIEQGRDPKARARQR